MILVGEMLALYDNSGHHNTTMLVSIGALLKQ